MHQKLTLLCVLMALLTIFPNKTLFAACISPAGVSGTVERFTSTSSYQVCDGTNWVRVRQDTVPSTACAQANGTINYNSTSNRLTLCQNSILSVLRSGTVGAACSPAGKIDYFPAEFVYKYCNGSNWLTIDAAQVAMPSSGLVSYWALNESSGTALSDSSGLNTGAFVDVPVWMTTGGRTAGALSLDGVNDYASVADAASLDITGDITLAGWVYLNAQPPTSGTTANPRIFQKGATISTGAANTVAYMLDIDSTGGAQTKPSLCIYISNASSCVTGATNVPLASWHHVAGVRSGTSLTVYIDGVLDATATGTAGSIDNEGTLYLGESQGNSDGLLYGRLDDLRIFNRALSATEIENIVLTAPSTVAFTPTLIDPGNQTIASFQIMVGDPARSYGYSYAITSSGGGTNVTGSGTMAASIQNVTGVDLSGLTDGTLTLTVTLTDATGAITAPTNTVTKDTTIVVLRSTSAASANPTASSCTATACAAGYVSAGCEWGEAATGFNDTGLTNATVNSLAPRMANGFDGTCTRVNSIPTGNSWNKTTCAQLCMRNTAVLNALHLQSLSALSTNPTASTCIAPDCAVGYTSGGCEWGEGTHNVNDTTLNANAYSSLLSRMVNGFDGTCTHTHSNPTGNTYNKSICTRLCIPNP